MATWIRPPVYLASMRIGCWRCGAAMPVVAIVAPNVPELEGEICTLSTIKSLPAPLRSYIQKRFPTFQLKYSKTTRLRCYVNTCPACGVLSGDFFLHSEPGGPFFPTEAEEARELVIEEVPLTAAVEVDAGLGMGTGELILQYGTRRTPGGNVHE